MSIKWQDNTWVHASKMNKTLVNELNNKFQQFVNEFNANVTAGIMSPDDGF